MSFIIQPSAAGGLTKVTRTSNTVLTGGNSGNWISITSGTFTQTFDPCANLGSTWFVYLENAGTGDITLDPSGSETIDGLTSYIMYPGEVRLIQSDGVSLTSIVIGGFLKTFTSSGTFTKPPGYASFSGLLWGGGGGGAKTNTTSGNASGGGGGACHPFTINQSTLSASTTVTIASGGAGATTAAAGSPGGTSSFSNVYAYGGGGGQRQASGTTQMYGGGGGGIFAAGTLGGTSNTNDGLPGSPGITQGDNNYVGGTNRSFVAVYGGAGGGAGPSPGGTVGPGGDSFYGGAGGGGISFGSSQTPGTGGGVSSYGGNGGGVGVSTDGQDGSAPGGGGGVTHTGSKAGDGARGELRIWGIV